MTPQSNRWEHVQNLPDTQFRRLTGVKRATFALMVQAVNAAEQTKKKSGKPHKLTTEDRVLLSLEYLQDYPTYLRLSVNWGVHESTAKRINNRVEDILIKDPRFHVPGKKALLENPNLEVVVVDASERPIERPKKATQAIQARQVPLWDQEARQVLPSGQESSEKLQREEETAHAQKAVGDRLENQTGDPGPSGAGVGSRSHLRGDRQRAQARSGFAEGFTDTVCFGSTGQSGQGLSRDQEVALE